MTKVIARREALARIAERILNLETLEARNSDSLDFPELAVWNVEEALIAAYKAGAAAALKDSK